MRPTARANLIRTVAIKVCQQFVVSVVADVAVVVVIS